MLDFFIYRQNVARNAFIKIPKKRNIASQSLQILYRIVLRAKIVIDTNVYKICKLRDAVFSTVFIYPLATEIFNFG